MKMAHPFIGSESGPSEAQSRSAGPSKTECKTFSRHAPPARSASGVPSYRLSTLILPKPQAS